MALGLLLRGDIFSISLMGMPISMQTLGGVLWGVAAIWLGVALAVEQKARSIAALE